MDLQQFYNLAIEAAKERGYENPNVTTISGCFKGNISHSINIWDGVKHIYSAHHKSPEAALQSFKDAIDFNNKQYPDNIESIEISWKRTGSNYTNVDAPLYQQVQDWFREKHNISIELHWQQGSQGWSYCYGYNAGDWFFPKETYKYYEALTKAIEEAIKLI